jgi:hypothetical protein
MAADRRAGPAASSDARRARLRLPRPWQRRTVPASTGSAGEVLYQERRHPIWFFARCWVWLLLLAVALPVTLRAEEPASQLVGGVFVLVGELAILLSLIDWTTTQVVIRRAGLQVVGYEGQLHAADLRITAPRIIQSRLGRTLGYAHLVTRRPGLRPKTSSQMFLPRPDDLRAAVAVATTAAGY